MSYKHVGTPADLVRFGCALKVECRNCYAARTLSGIEVLRFHASNARLEWLEKRLVCSRCKKKAAKLVVLPPVYPD